MEIATIIDRGRERDWQTVEADEVEPVRIAVVGVGEFTRTYALPAFERSAYCTPTVLVSGSVEKARAVGASLDTDIAAIGYEAFVDGEAVDRYDAVYIVTPNGRHLEYVRAASSFGKAVMCEKPMEATVDRAEELVAACVDANVPLMIAYRMHTVPLVRRARELVQRGAIGTPVAVDGRISAPIVPDPSDNPDVLEQWRLDRELAGGGALFDIGIYPLNTARFLLDADPIGVRGHVAHPHEAFDEVEGSVWYDLEFPEDVIASGFASYDAQMTSSYTVTGTAGQVRIAEPVHQRREATLELRRGNDRHTMTLEGSDHMLEEFDYFAHQVRTGELLYADGEHGLVDMRLMEAIYADAESDEWTRPP